MTSRTVLIVGIRLPVENDLNLENIGLNLVATAGIQPQVNSPKSIMIDPGTGQTSLDL